MIFDLWLLGYQHVIATFTRLAFDRQSLKEYRFLVFVLPLIVFFVTFMLAWSIGVWVIASIYLYWQWFHYTRQSWGVSQVYRGKSNGLAKDGELFAKVSFWLVPIWGILYRSWQAPDEFIFAELRVIPVPELLVDVVGIAAVISLLLWSCYRFRDWRNNQLPLAHTYYMVTHFLIFLVSYRLIEDITHGWLVINIWHNAQYILFVWLFNTNRFKQGIDPKSFLISTLSQPQHKVRYFLFCVGLATLFYLPLSGYLQTLDLWHGVPLFIIVFQAVNFHHYIVDSLIWKIRKKPLKKTLDLI